MTSLRKIRERSIKSHRNLETSIGFYRSPIGIYKDNIEIDDELEKYLRNIKKSPIEILTKSIGFYRNPIGICKDHIKIDDELEKHQRNNNINPIEILRYL